MIDPSISLIQYICRVTVSKDCDAKMPFLSTGMAEEYFKSLFEGNFLITAFIRRFCWLPDDAIMTYEPVFPVDKHVIAEGTQPVDHVSLAGIQTGHGVEVSFGKMARPSRTQKIDSGPAAWRVQVLSVHVDVEKRRQVSDGVNGSKPSVLTTNVERA